MTSRITALNRTHYSGMGNSGLLGSTRSQLWLSITQYTNKEVNCQLFRHIQE